MKVLPNGLRVFNATPHAITFWQENWGEVVVVDPDEIITAVQEEAPHGGLQIRTEEWGSVRNCEPNQTLEKWPMMRLTCVSLENVWFVKTEFIGDDSGHEIIKRAREDGAEVIVGSIIAAQAYRGDVVAMVPCEGYERVPPAEKRMRPDKFVVFPRK